MGWKEKLRNVFSRGHKDIYEAVKVYAQERGVATTDVVASAVSSYLAADEEGKDILEKTMAERRASGGGGGGADIEAAVKMFVDMTGGMTKLFEATNQLRASVSIGSMVSDFETVTGAVEKIKGLGSEKGKGSLDDVLADAFVRGLVKKVTGVDANLNSSSKKGKETGKSPIEVIKPE